MLRVGSGRVRVYGAGRPWQADGMGFIAFIIVGLVAGALAKAILPGRQGGGWLATMLLGIVGALVGGFLGGALFGVMAISAGYGYGSMGFVGAATAVVGFGVFQIPDAAQCERSVV